MKKFFLFFFFLVCMILTVKSQNAIHFIVPDTLHYSKTKNAPLDSVDVLNALPSNTMPGGGYNWQGNLLDASLFYANHGMLYSNPIQKKNLVYSGLPHVAFGYAFGNKSIQNVFADYQHAFTKRLLLNMYFRRNSGSGYLRNNAFRHTAVELLLKRSGKRYSFMVDASFHGDEWNTNKGITTDSLLEVFDLSFQPVRSESAKTKYQHTKIQYQQYFNFKNDSLNQFGLTSWHQVKVQNRRFSETDTLALLYPLVNYDSIQTRDQYQFGGVKNGLGIYFTYNKWVFEAGSYLHTWKVENLKFRSDSLESNVYFSACYKVKHFSFGGDFNANIQGAGQGTNLNLAAEYKLNDWKFSGSWSAQKMLPDYFQRQYYGNNIQYLNSDLQLQNRQKAELKATYRFLGQDVIVSANWNRLKDNYWYKNQNWSNDTLNFVRIASVETLLKLKWGIINFHPLYRYTWTDPETFYIPNHQVFARLFIKGSLFKARKMKAYVGCDFHWSSSYRLLNYHAQLNAFYHGNTSIINPGLLNLHAFLGFQIETFKFYFRFENLGYLMQKSSTYVLDRTPIPSTHFRFGITWDFFN